MGIDKYNEECRAIVMRYAKEWEATVTRLGRWIDFENDYKTLNASFMESVWWVFGQLWEKGLVYRGFKVCPLLSSCWPYKPAVLKEKLTISYVIVCALACCCCCCC